jgi:hypothetical protein
MHRLTREVFDSIKDMIEDLARKLEVSGVLVVTDLTKNVIMYANISGISTPASETPTDNDTAIALAMTGSVIKYRRNTPTLPLLEGEIGYEGGIISQDGEFAYAFSGARTSKGESDEEKNAYFASIAEQAHKTYRPALRIMPGPIEYVESMVNFTGASGVLLPQLPLTEDLAPRDAAYDGPPCNICGSIVMLAHNDGWKCCGCGWTTEIVR